MKRKFKILISLILSAIFDIITTYINHSNGILDTSLFLNYGFTTFLIGRIGLTLLLSYFILRHLGVKYVEDIFFAIVTVSWFIVFSNMIIITPLYLTQTTLMPISFIFICFHTIWWKHEVIE